MNTTITAASVSSTTIQEAIIELTASQEIQDLGYNGDTIEAIATHIVMTDTDWTYEIYDVSSHVIG